jgi:hypothetical protein
MPSHGRDGDGPWQLLIGQWAEVQKLPHFNRKSQIANAGNPHPSPPPVYQGRGREEEPSSLRRVEDVAKAGADGGDVLAADEDGHVLGVAHRGFVDAGNPQSNGVVASDRIAHVGGVEGGGLVKTSVDFSTAVTALSSENGPGAVAIILLLYPESGHTWPGYQRD